MEKYSAPHPIEPAPSSLILICWMSEVLNPTALNGMVTKLLSAPVVFPVYPTTEVFARLLETHGFRFAKMQLPCSEVQGRYGYL